MRIVGLHSGPDPRGFRHRQSRGSDPLNRSRWPPIAIISRSRKGIAPGWMNCANNAARAGRKPSRTLSLKSTSAVLWAGPLSVQGRSRIWRRMLLTEFKRVWNRDRWLRRRFPQKLRILFQALGKPELLVNVQTNDVLIFHHPIPGHNLPFKSVAADFRPTYR